MKISNIFGRVITKITSGRWLVTMAATICLVMLTKTLCWLMVQGKITLEASTYVAVVMSVLNTIGAITMFYFQRDRNYNKLIDNSDLTLTTTTTTLLPK